MSLGAVTLNVIGEAAVKKLADGRKQITRRWEVISDDYAPDVIEQKCFQDPGTPDGYFDGSFAGAIVGGRPNKHYPELRLIDQEVSQPRERQSKAILVKVYEEIPESAEVQFGKDALTVDANGRHVLTRITLQFSSATYTAGTPGTVLTVGSTSYALNTSEKTDTGTLRTITRQYVEATDTFTQVGPDRIDYDLNGLKRISQLIVAKGGTDFPVDIAVGVTPYDGCVLASIKDADSTLAVARLQLQWLQPVVLSKSRSPGPIHGSIQYNWQTWMLDATDATDMGGALNTIPGELISDTDSDFQGYKSRSFTSVAPIGEGTLAGVKYTYSDVVDVRVPGTVALTTQAVTAGDLSGTIAVPNVTPPTTKSVTATVTVQITTTPSGMSGTPAYDLGAISCSVVATQASYNANGFDSMSTLDGKNTSSAPRRSASIGARTVNYPGHYLVGTPSATGTFSYVGGVQYSRTSDGTVVSGTDLTSTDVNKLTGYGSTAATNYVTTGIISRSKPRAVLQTLAGVTYYEVVTWSV